MKNIKIIGSSYVKADLHVTNFDLEKIIDTSDEWITQRTGIKSRYISTQKNTSQLAADAAEIAIKNAGIDKEKIDLIVVATFTPDHFTPSCACLVQAILGMNAQPVMAFDINAACSGFLYGFQIVSSMLSTGQAKCALVIGSEVISKLLDFEDRSTCILFGDGAGAWVVAHEENSKEIFHLAGSKGDQLGLLQASAMPLIQELKKPKAHVATLSMEGSEVFRFAVKAMTDSIVEIVQKANKTLDDIDLFIPHQANIRIIQYVCKQLNISQDKMIVNLDQFGNTSAASIPIAYGQAVEEGKIKKGMKLVFVGFGSGLTWAATYVEI